MEDKYLYLWFGMIGNMVHTSKMKVVVRYGGIDALWNASEDVLRDELTEAAARNILENRNIDAVKRYEELLVKKGITYIYQGHELYPQNLYNIPDPPVLLFAAGDTNILANEGKSIAVVGARKASVYGRTMADKLSGELASQGVVIISGMAAGIDGAAHRAAIRGGGKTIAVLGSGIDVLYPRENYDIYHELLCGAGVVISEYGLGIKPEPFRFPYRNRIISGMADGVLVVEAREKSGSLITADQALEQGRDVYVVPGRATDEASKGCNNLIKNGAFCVTDSSDILENLGIQCTDGGLYSGHTKDRKNADVCTFTKNSLAPAEKKVYSCVRLESRHIDDICFDSGIPVSEAAQILCDLERKKMVKQIVRNYYVRV